VSQSKTVAVPKPARKSRARKANPEVVVPEGETFEDVLAASEAKLAEQIGDVTPEPVVSEADQAAAEAAAARLAREAAKNEENVVAREDGSTPEAPLAPLATPEEKAQIEAALAAEDKAMGADLLAAPKKSRSRKAKAAPAAPAAPQEAPAPAPTPSTEFPYAVRAPVAILAGKWAGHTGVIKMHWAAGQTVDVVLDGVGFTCRKKYGAVEVTGPAPEAERKARAPRAPRAITLEDVILFLKDASPADLKAVADVATVTRAQRKEEAK
jgi:hypothetical protein